MIDWSKLVTAEDKAALAENAAREAENIKGRAYLASTDWYVSRLQETGQAVPDEVLKRRAEARASVIDSTSTNEMLEQGWPNQQEVNP